MKGVFWQLLEFATTTLLYQCSAPVHGWGWGWCMVRVQQNCIRKLHQLSPRYGSTKRQYYSTKIDASISVHWHLAKRTPFWKNSYLSSNIRITYYVQLCVFYCYSMYSVWSFIIRYKRGYASINWITNMYGLLCFGILENNNQLNIFFVISVSTWLAQSNIRYQNK